MTALYNNDATTLFTFTLSSASALLCCDAPFPLLLLLSTLPYVPLSILLLRTLSPVLGILFLFLLFRFPPFCPNYFPDSHHRPLRAVK